MLTTSNNELVSIIMPCYNASDFITETVNSVLNQTYINFELIIIDDASTDDSVKIIEKYQDPRIKLIILKDNGGVAISRNKGIEQARGQYISFLDSDDLWLPEKLNKQIILLKQNWPVVCSNYSTFKKNHLNIENQRISPEIIYFQDMLKSNFIGNLTGIYNCKILGKFYQKNIGHEDYIMWLEILKKSRKAYCIQESLANYRLSSKSLSGNKIKAIKWQWYIYRRELKLSIIKSSYYFSHYILNAFKKRR